MTASNGKSHRVLHILLVLIAAVLLVVVLSRALGGREARAQTATSAATGSVIATRLCISCHAVGSEGARTTVPADIPSFLAIANKSGQTTEAIAGRIVVPHPPMPQLALTRDEIAAVSAYIMSLRK